MISTIQSQSIEAERAVIGTVLLDQDIIDEIGPLLEPRDFTVYSHQLIWKAMLYQYRNNKPIDLVTLTHMMQQYNRLDEIGGVNYLTDLSQAAPTAANAKYYAEIVHFRALRNRGAQVGEQITRLATEGDVEDEEAFLAELERLALGVRPQHATEMKTLKETGESYMEYLKRKDELIPTGFPTFDRWAGGLGRGWLYILAGRPSVGKTAKALQMARGIAEQDAGEVLIFSQEMKREQLISRMIAPLTQIPFGRFSRKNFNPSEWQQIEEAYNRLEQLPIHIDDTSSVSIEKVKSVARQIKRRHGRIGAIIVDYLTIMHIPQEKGITWAQAVGEVTKAAKQMAMEIECPFIMLAQMNRESKKATKPGLEHLKDSGNIEQDADVVEFLWENPDDADPGAGNNGAKVVQSLIAKGRSIGVNQFRYIFNGMAQEYKEAGPR